jgi:hypothetical protein
MEETLSSEKFGIYPSNHMALHPRRQRIVLHLSNLLVNVKLKAGREHSYVNC